MPVKFDWGLDPEGPGLRELFGLDPEVTVDGDEVGAIGGGDEQNLPENAPQMEDCPRAVENACAAAQENAAPLQENAAAAQENNDQIPDPCNDALDAEVAGAVAEFYMNSEMSGNSLPNDDIWKKFEIYDPVGNHREKVEDINDDMYDDLANLTWMSPMYSQSMTNDAREIRHHDCMWAGHCISEKHERYNQRNPRCNNLLPLRRPHTGRQDESEVIPVSTPEGAAFAEVSRFNGRRNGVVAPTHERSVLLPSRVVNATSTSKRSASARSHTVTTSMRSRRSRTLDSGGESPRPETPQSLSDHEDLNLDLPDMRSVEDLVGDALGYNFMNDMVQNLGNEASNAYGPGDDFSGFDRQHQGAASSNASSSAGSAGSAGPASAAGSSRSGGNRLKRPAARMEVPASRHYMDNSFFSDHSYHLSKSARMDNLGVQTPSDSEMVVETSRTVGSPNQALSPGEETRPRQEEIDVETVYGEFRKPNSRSSSSGSVLPTNPSLSDRQQLQLTVASAINKKDAKKPSARTATVTSRGSDDDRTLKARVVTGVKRKVNDRVEARRTAATRRSADFDEGDDFPNKPAKRRRLQNQSTPRGRGRARRSGRASARSNGGSSDSEVDSIERRTIHNSMERQRRIDLRNSFEELRKLIPSTAGNEKAAKVLILSSGAEFCRALAIEDHELTRKKAELRRQQEMLMARVSQLRRSLAAQR